MTSEVTYIGALRTSSVHIKSGSVLISDAPTDNHGKGESFSPTDAVANSLASCMFTVMGIKAENLELDLSGSTAAVTKHMQPEPRKISGITIEFTMRVAADEKSRTVLERTAMTCPVYLSLHPDIKKEITFNWL